MAKGASPPACRRGWFCPRCCGDGGSRPPLCCCFAVAVVAVAGCLCLRGLLFAVAACLPAAGACCVAVAAVAGFAAAFAVVFVGALPCLHGLAATCAFSHESTERVRGWVKTSRGSAERCPPALWQASGHSSCFGRWLRFSGASALFCTSAAGKRPFCFCFCRGQVALGTVLFVGKGPTDFPSPPPHPSHCTHLCSFPACAISGGGEVLSRL